jgi:hypothetical protein
MSQPTPAPSEQTQPPNEVADLAATSTRRLASEAAIYAVLNGLVFGLLGLLLFDRDAGAAGAVRSGLFFGGLMFVVLAATTWHRRRKARQGRHWARDD